MLEFQRGDDSAFDRIVVHYRSHVRRFIYRYVQDPERVEDLSQEAFLRVYRARGRYRPSAGFRTWLFTIVTRLCLNDIRSRKRERRVIVPLPGASSQDGGEDFLDGIADRKDEPGEIALERSELARAIRSAIEDLPPAQRAAVLLLRFEELSYREIAEAMGLSVMAVKSLLHRGREGLRERLARYLDLPPEEQGGREPGEKRKEDRRHAR